MSNGVKDKKSKIFKIAIILNVGLLLIGAGVAAHYVFFRQIEIKIEQIEWIDEFEIGIAEIEIRNEPCFLVVKPKDSKIISERELYIQKQDIKIGRCTNSRILVPLRIESRIKEFKDLFFVPQFRARIDGEEKIKADFSLHLLSDNCQKGMEEIKGKGFVLCDIGISSSNVRSFSITDRRKNILADKIRIMADKFDYVLVLEISPCLEAVKNLSSFLITIENITPELIIEPR